MNSEYIKEYRKIKGTFIAMLSITVFFLAIFILYLIDGIIKMKLQFETVITFIWLLGFPWGIWFWIKNWRQGKAVVFIGIIFGIFILPYGIYHYVASLKQLSKMIKTNNSERAEADQKKTEESVNNTL